MQHFAGKERHRLNCSSFVSLVVCLLLAGCSGAPKHPTWKNATGAEQHERLMWQAIRDKDWDNFERRLSPTFIGVNSDGQMFDRAGWLALWKGAQIKEVILGDFLVQPEGVDMKVTCIIHFQADGAGLSAPTDLRVLSVWQQVKTRWILTATSITPIRNN
jgi:hypothetical protein